MKKLVIILFSLFVVTACDGSSYIAMPSKLSNGEDNFSININQNKDKQLTRSCVETEGDYETSSKCIHVENNCFEGKTGKDMLCDGYLMTVTDKKTNNILKMKAGDWAPNNANLYNFYGFQAKYKGKIYELDLRYKGDEPADDDPIYYREWNKNRTKKLFEEKVIVQP